MELFFSPLACSMSARIALAEAGAAANLIEVDPDTKRMLATGEDYRAINPLGYVPALRLDDEASPMRVGDFNPRQALVRYRQERRRGQGKHSRRRHVGHANATPDERLREEQRRRALVRNDP